MLYQLSDVLTIEGKQESVSVSLELESLDTVMGHYPILDKPSFQMSFAYIEKGKSTYITNSIDNARCLTKSLSPNDIKRLFKELNVSDINEYVMYYYNGDKKSVKYN